VRPLGTATVVVALLVLSLATAARGATIPVAIPLGGAGAPVLHLRVHVRAQSSPSVAAAASAAGAQAATVTLGDPVDAPAVPDGFLGLSIEYPTVAVYAEQGALFDQVLANLTPDQRPVIRVGGQSTDHAWIPVPGQHNLGLWYGLGPRWLAAARAFAQGTHARMVMGLDFEVNNPAVPIAEARAFKADLGGSLAAFELGNEPDLYTVWPWYSTHGHRVFSRPTSWSPSGYVAQERTVVPALGSTPLWGPGLDAGSRWWNSIGPITGGAPHLSTLTDHAYATSCYSAPSSADWPTVANLLAPRASTGLATGAAADIAWAHATGRAFRIDETNTVSCDGAMALSGFAASLWAIQAGFALTRAGVDGINVHTFPYAKTRLFTFRGHLVSVADEYYGWMLFARAAPPRARLLSVQVSGNPEVQAFATHSRAGTQVVLLNASATQGARVSLAAAGTSVASVEPLRGAGLARAGRMSFAGLSIAAGNGRLSGRASVAALGGRGRYSLWLPPASADLVGLSR
jgi:hypothetical protein